MLRSSVDTENQLDRSFCPSNRQQGYPPRIRTPTTKAKVGCILHVGWTNMQTDDQVRPRRVLLHLFIQNKPSTKEFEPFEEDFNTIFTFHLRKFQPCLLHFRRTEMAALNFPANFETSSAQGDRSAKSLAGNVVNSSLSSLSSTSHCCLRGASGGGGWGQGTFHLPSLYCTTIWCFALKGLRTIPHESN